MNSLGTILGIFGAIVSIGTLCVGYFTLRTTARTSFVDELRKEIDLLRAKVKSVEDEHAKCVGAIEQLRSENRSLMMELIRGSGAKEAAALALAAAKDAAREALKTAEEAARALAKANHANQT